jgi:hypothetical protein
MVFDFGNMGGWKFLVCLLLLIDLCSSFLVEQQPLVLTYHNGPLLTTRPAVDVHVIWYGRFSPAQRSIVADFVQSLEASKAIEPSVYSWWKTTERYSGRSNKAMPIANTRLGKQKLDAAYSLGKSLKRSHITVLVDRAIASRALPVNSNAVYLVLTSDDVTVEGFCMSCGFHANIFPRKNFLLPYAWVGNSETQCPGQCAWPFHQPIYGPQTPPLVAPNGDMGIDGMIINIATVLAGAVTNPFNTGYYQGDAGAPLEAVSACPGIYANGSYPGYPGNLLVDKITGASYNGHGLNGRKFLLPAMWDPATRSCKTLV